MRQRPALQAVVRGGAPPLLRSLSHSRQAGSSTSAYCNECPRAPAPARGDAEAGKAGVAELDLTCTHLHSLQGVDIPPSLTVRTPRTLPHALPTTILFRHALESV